MNDRDCNVVMGSIANDPCFNYLHACVHTHGHHLSYGKDRSWLWVVGVDDVRSPHIFIIYLFIYLFN